MGSGQCRGSWSPQLQVNLEVGQVDKRWSVRSIGVCWEQLAVNRFEKEPWSVSVPQNVGP